MRPPQLLLGAIFVLLMGCTLVTAPPATAPAAATDVQSELLQAARAAAVVLRSTGGGGSGACVYQDTRSALVLTAAHVVEGDLVISIGTEAGQVYPGKVLYQDDYLDLAVVETLPVFQSVARMVEADTGWRFAPVLCYGFPALVGPDGHPTFGLVASERDLLWSCKGHDEFGKCIDEGQVLAWRVTAPTFFGNSGGAVYVRDAKGWALAGVSQRIVVSMSGAATHIGFSSPPAPTKAAVRAALYVMKLREEARRGN